MLSYIFYDVEANVFQQLGRFLHDFRCQLVNRLVVHRFTQLIVLCSLKKVGGNSDIQGIFITDSLFFGVISVVGKKFESFEADGSQ